MAVIAEVLRGIGASTGGGFTRVTVTDQVRETLRQAILTGLLPGGTRLALAVIAEALGVSTTPVREALRVLASEGFVHLDPYRGGIVRSPDRNEIEEVIRLRQALEPLAVEEAIAGMTHDILGEARVLLQTMLDRPNSDKWVEANREFHEIHYRGASSERLLEMLAGLRAPVVMYVSRAVIQHEGFRIEANRQHVALFEAMAERDVATAIEIIRHHVALPIAATEKAGEDVVEGDVA